MVWSVQQPWVLDWARRRISRVFFGCGGSGMFVTWSQPLSTVSIFLPVTGSMYVMKDLADPCFPDFA
jgi:hypothetical protein